MTPTPGLIRTSTFQSRNYKKGIMTSALLVLCCSIAIFSALCFVTAEAQSNKTKKTVKIYPVESKRPSLTKSGKPSSSAANPSTVGIRFESLTPDGRGGVWISGSVLEVALMMRARPDVEAIVVPEATQIDHVVFTSPTKGWMTANHGRLLYSTTDDLNWNQLDLGARFRHLFFLNETLGWPSIRRQKQWPLGQKKSGKKNDGKSPRPLANDWLI